MYGKRKMEVEEKERSYKSGVEIEMWEGVHGDGTGKKEKKKLTLEENGFGRN